MPTTDTFETVLLRKELVADQVVLLTLATPDASQLPAWQAGAHIDLHLGDPAVVRQYSLCSSPADRTTYQVAVLREPQSRGGSAFVHDSLAVGDKVLVGGPRNNFDLVDARRYIFIAGGIGITPMIPMIEATNRAGADWTLLYGGRTAASMAFTEQLAAIDAQRIHVRPRDECGLLDLAGLLAQPETGTAVYCCGPEPLLKAAEEACGVWPAGSLHAERFAPLARGNDGTDSGFEVEFAQTGITLVVPPEESIIDVAEEAGIPVVYSCQEGTCGSCEVAVIDGQPDHRDSILTEAERAAGKTMMICVSRAKTPRLILDL
ncbi:PDR/VanB family oxidoreductase [Dactylosporangium sp. CA-092794]|uniref:PDR/VanB family oxidoreductase n=1 Tax=Dactylosporangium sp. CA-092794 TaxID=3239929 RepID=UPI003D90298A